jgi:Tol biopolymer transport system component
MFRRYLMILLVLLTSVVVVRAQDEPTAPIIALAKGDFWAINPDDGSLTQITHHRQDLYYYQPYSQRDMAISPDGQYLAYLQTPRFFAIAMKNDLVGNIGSAPADVVLLDLKTGVEKVIAGQQQNVKYDEYPRLWYRSYPTWSPDGRQLAFIQTRGRNGQPSFQSQIMLYWVDDQQTVPFVNSKQRLGELAWIMEGLSSGTTSWDIGGGLIIHNYLHKGMVYEHFTPYQNDEYMIVDSADVIPHNGRVYVMKLLTGEYGVVEGIQSSISDTSPDDSLVFIKDDNDTRPAYVIDPKTGNRFDPPRKAPYAVDFTISPDGRRFAYILIGTSVNISDLNGHDLTVPLPANTILWGRKRYTIASKTGDQSAFVDPTADFENAKRCGTVPPVDLVLEGQGKVLAGNGANRIRSTPSPDADVIGQIPEGATFNVVYGQQHVCNGGIRWAQVEYKGVTGWTAEGADGEAFLEAIP